MFTEMSDAEFVRQVRVVCHVMAYRRCRRENPASTRATAWEYAVRHWRDFWDAALDFLAIRALYREARELPG